MKKTLVVFIGMTVLFLTSCGDSNLNKATSYTNAEKTFFVGTDAEGKNNYFIAMRIDTVIDDITPYNPDALMGADNKIIKICYSSDNIDYNNKAELDYMNVLVYNTKTKKEYQPSLRDNESNYRSWDGFFTVDVPKDTKIEDLSVGIYLDEDKDFEGFISLKDSGKEPKSDDLVSVNKEQTYSSVLRGDGNVKITLKSITYNVSDKDKIAKEMHELRPLAKVVKVDFEYKLVDGEEADINSLSYLFTEYRAQFSSKTTTDLGYSIAGNGTTKTTSNYFVLFADETIVAITDSQTSPSLAFEFGK